jgi:hypothetical protein
MSSYLRRQGFGANAPGGTDAPIPSQVRPAVQYVEDFFVYEINFLALASGATQNGVIQIDADSDFKWVKGTHFTDIAAAAVNINNLPQPLATVQILDGSSSRQLSSAPVPVPSLFGVPGLPFILPVPKIFKARSTINITITSYEAVNTNNIRLQFMGNKIYQQGSVPQIPGFNQGF